MGSQGPIPKRPPSTRTINVRSTVIALDGMERPYPVYRFSRGPFFERPRHNPFKPETPQSVIISPTDLIGFDWNGGKILTPAIYWDWPGNESFDAATPGQWSVNLTAGTYVGGPLDGLTAVENERLMWLGPGLGVDGTGFSRQAPSGDGPTDYGDAIFVGGSSGSPLTWTWTVNFDSVVTLPEDVNKDTNLPGYPFGFEFTSVTGGSGPTIRVNFTADAGDDVDAVAAKIKTFGEAHPDIDLITPAGDGSGDFLIQFAVGVATTSATSGFITGAEDIFDPPTPVDVTP